MSQNDPLDRLCVLTSCLKAVADLLASSSDLHIVSPDNLALLLDTLVAEQRAALDNFKKAA